MKRSTGACKRCKRPSSWKQRRRNRTGAKGVPAGMGNPESSEEDDDASLAEELSIRWPIAAQLARALRALVAPVGALKLEGGLEPRQNFALHYSRASAAHTGTQDESHIKPLTARLPSRKEQPMYCNSMLITVAVLPRWHRALLQHYT